MAHHVCPWWMGYLLAGPLRRRRHPPEKILAPFVFRGMTALDVGCGMGHFSLPLARMVGGEGRVICIDLQEKMINSLRRRATRAGLIRRLDLRVCSVDSLGIDNLAGRVDFVLLFAVAHEVPDVPGLFRELHSALRSGGTLLLAEPSNHVKPDEFARTVTVAESAGLIIIERPEISKSHTVLLKRE